MTTREEFLARRRQRRDELEEVTVPGEDEPLYIRSLGAQEGTELLDGVEPRDLPFVLIVATVTDADGKPVFQSGDEKELAETLTLAELNALFLPAARKNGLGSQAVEEAMEGFEPPQDDSSSTE